MLDALASPLTGSRVALEPIEPRHEAGLRAASADPQVFRWMPYDLSDAASFDAWFAGVREAAARRELAAFATVERAGGTVIGSTCYLEPRPHDRSVEIGGTWLAPAAWGGGANVEATLLMFAHAFDVLGCVRVELKTDARNERSRRAMEALPAQFEGVHRQHRVLADGTLRDSAWYSVLDREWPEVRANLQRRLAARG
ncbi:MAG TPA: GNAT family protein [Conexibacter sp.]|nr:GNAT family protein [Conexibacter sp.]